ncbi:putative uncharacterized protein SPANXA2-OT1 [Plecturocebus cupreus]
MRRKPYRISLTFTPPRLLENKQIRPLSPVWSAVVRSQLTATPTSRVQAILLPQPPEKLGLQEGKVDGEEKGFAQICTTVPEPQLHEQSLSPSSTPLSPTASTVPLRSILALMVRAGDQAVSGQQQGLLKLRRSDTDMERDSLAQGKQCLAARKSDRRTVRGLGQLLAVVVVAVVAAVVAAAAVAAWAAEEQPGDLKWRAGAEAASLGTG